ncbi:hypothetical protein HQ560_02325, partial [bacterium]|nr:hypothetical protein [bacterium]
MRSRLYLLFLLCLATAHAAAPNVAPWSKDRLDREWKRRFEPVRERMGSRDLCGFALEAAAANLYPDRVARALALAEQMQDRDPASRTYGNFKWYWNAEGPQDRNAVEFCMQKGILVWMHYRDRLNAEARERLERLIRFSVEGIRLHRVSELYTNIFLMKIWNCIAIGENTGRPDLAQEGYEMLDRWLVATWENGVAEYISPTYTGVDIDSLALLHRFAKDERTRRHAELALRLLWTSVAANWYEPAQRLGGAHSRDYDFLTGHGYTDNHLRMLGWISDPTPYDLQAFFQLCRWDPPAELRALSMKTPRLVQQRWRAGPGGTAVQYVGKRFSVGSAGAAYHCMDKPLTINLPGGPKMPMINVFMDARGDAYGKKRFPVGGGHSKTLHLKPFLTSVQRGPEVLMLLSAHPKDPMFQRYFPESTCLLTQIVLPANAEFWLGEKKIAPQPGQRWGARMPLFLKIEDVVVGIRVVHSRGTRGVTAPAELIFDGGKYGAVRLTVTHSKSKPTSRGTTALWVRAEEGGDFAAFRKAMAQAIGGVVDGTRIDIAVPGQKGDLRLVADVAAGARIAAEGGEPGTGEALLAVDGRDYGRELLGKVDVIARYQNALDAA